MRCWLYVSGPGCLNNPGVETDVESFRLALRKLAAAIHGKPEYRAAFFALVVPVGRLLKAGIPKHFSTGYTRNLRVGFASSIFFAMLLIFLRGKREGEFSSIYSYHPWFSS